MMFNLRGKVFLLGFSEGCTCLRITSIISMINFPRREITTESGRIYALQNSPTQYTEKIALIAAYYGINSLLPNFLYDISEETWKEMMSIH